MDNTVNIINNIKELADFVMNPTDNSKHFEQAQNFLQSLGDNLDINDEQLCDLIQNRYHYNSLYFAVQGLVNRIVRYSEKYSDDYIHRIWTLLSEIARNEERSYPHFVCQQCLKGTVLILHVNYFTQVVSNDKKGPMFEYFSSIKNQQQAAKYLLYFLDEFIYQCQEKWRLPLNLPWDHHKSVHEHLDKYLLSSLLEFALELMENIMNTEEISEENNCDTVTHFCEFLHHVLYFDNKEEDAHYFHPPKNWGPLMLRLVNDVFNLYDRVQHIPGVSYQMLELLVRLSYASGDVFKVSNHKSKYVATFTKRTCTILQSIRQENLYQILDLLQTLTMAMYRDASFDSTISTFAKHVADALNNIGPSIVKELLTDNDLQRRGLTKMFFNSMKNIFDCLSDDDEGSTYFYPVVSNVFKLLLNCNKCLDQSEDKRRDYKLITSTITDVAMYRFDDFYNSLIQGAIERFNDLNNQQNLMSLQWFFLEIADILSRCFSVKDGYERFQGIVIQQRKSRLNTSEVYMEAYNAALHGTFVDISNFNFIGGLTTFLLWWLSLAQEKLQHDNSDLKSDNANALAATFWAIRHMLQANHDIDAKCSGLCDEKLIEQEMVEPHVIRYRTPLFGNFVKYLLDKLFFFIAHYREFPHLVNEALDAVQALVDNGYFLNHISYFMEYIAMDMSSFPDRRKLFGIAAKAAVRSNNYDAEQFCNTALSPYSAKFQMLSEVVDEENMIMIIEIFTGFADILAECELDSYGNMVCGLFAALSKIYPVYQSYPKTVEKILEFYTVAVPRVIFFNISIGEANSTADTIIGFMQVYCQYNVERWNALDDDKQNNQGYDDLVLLMQIVKDALFQLAISSYDEEDESNITVIQRMGHLCLNTFVPLCTPSRASVPDVLNAFTNMLHAVAEYDISSVISQVKTHDHPLFRIIYESLDNTRQNPTIARALSALNFILERYTIIYTIETWHDFAHLLVDRVFTIVINDIADCDLHRLSKESLFYMIWDDKKFFGYYAQHIVNLQPQNNKNTVMEAFNELCNFGVINHVSICRMTFDDNVKNFLQRIAGVLRFIPGSVDMVALTSSYKQQVQEAS